MTLDKRQYDLRDLTAGLTSGQTDVAFLRQPLSAPGLAHEPISSSPASPSSRTATRSPAAPTSQ